MIPLFISLVIISCTSQSGGQLNDFQAAGSNDGGDGARVGFTWRKFLDKRLFNTLLINGAGLRGPRLLGWGSFGRNPSLLGGGTFGLYG